MKMELYIGQVQKDELNNIKIHIIMVKLKYIFLQSVKIQNLNILQVEKQKIVELQIRKILTWVLILDKKEHYILNNILLEIEIV